MRTAKNLGRKLLALGLCVGLLVTQLPLSYAETQSTQVKVTYEGKSTLPSVGTVRLTVESSNNKGLEGKLEIAKTNSSSGSENESNRINSQYNVSIPAGQTQTTVLYRTDLGGDTMSNYNYDYTFTSGSQVLGKGTLTSTLVGANESILLVGDTLSKDAILKNALNSSVTQKNKLSGITTDELSAFDNIIMSHEDALSLSEDERELVRGRVYDGSRLIILSTRGHDKKNFGEVLLGEQFSATGMSNLKSTINLLTRKSDAKDYWLETGQTGSGEVMTYGAYGKGSILLLGFNPFTLDQLNSEDLSALRKTILIQFNANLKGMETYDYQLVGISSKLPEKAVPSFSILLLVFGLSLSFGLIFGMYLVRYKKRPHGLLIGMCSAAALSLVMIPLYSWMLGYKGAFVNEVVFNRVDENGDVSTERYAGIKGNKGRLTVVTENQTGLVPTRFDFYSGHKKELVNLVGDGQNQWVLERDDKWMMESFASKAIRQNLAVGLSLENVEVAETQIKGNLVNKTGVSLASPVLFVDDKWVVLPRVEAGESKAFSFDIQSLENLLDSNQMSAIAKGIVYQGTEKQIGADEFRAIMESAKNKQTTRAMLVAYQTVEGSGISLENESEKYRQLVCYSLAMGGESQPKQLTLGHMNALSGGTKKTTYANFSEFQTVGDNGDFEFIASFDTAKNKSYVMNYDINQVKGLSVFDKKLGIWTPIKNGENLSGEGVFYKVSPLNTYISGDAIKLSEKEGN